MAVDPKVPTRAAGLGLGVIRQLLAQASRAVAFLADCGLATLGLGASGGLGVAEAGAPAAAAFFGLSKLRAPLRLTLLAAGASDGANDARLPSTIAGAIPFAACLLTCSA